MPESHGEGLAGLHPFLGELERAEVMALPGRPEVHERVMRRDDDAPARRENPSKLGQRSRPIVEVVHHQRRHHDVEGRRPDGQTPAEICLDQRDVGSQTVSGDREQVRADIDAGDCSARGGEVLRQHTAAATGIQHPPAGDVADQCQRRGALVQRVVHVVLDVGVVRRRVLVVVVEYRHDPIMAHRSCRRVPGVASPNPSRRRNTRTG